MMHPPGPRGLETFGFARGGSLAGTLLFLQQVARRYGPFSSFRFLTKRIYLADDPELIREILVTRQHEFIRDSGATLLRELVGDGLLTSEEPFHKERRRILQPAFHREQISDYAAAMSDAAEEMTQSWRDGSTIDPAREMRRLTLTVVGTTLFGSDLRGAADEISRTIERVIKKAAWLAPLFAFVEPVAIAYRRILPKGPSPLFRSERAALEPILTPIISQRRSVGGRDILSLVLNARDASDATLPDAAVRNEIVTFVLAGHETTATALTWTWHLLAGHPDVEARLHAELRTVLNGRTPTIEDLPELRYTSSVFKEALRLYPPALLFARRPKRDAQLRGYTVRAGESIFLSPFITGRNEAYFDRPDEFRPERWDTFDGPKQAYFPFGAGAKSCIGEAFARTEVILVIAALAQQWCLQHVEGSPKVLNAGPILPPGRSFPMRLRARALGSPQARSA